MKRRELVLDGHVHCGTWTPDRVGWPSCSVADVRAAQERCGIDGGVVFPTDVGDNEGLLASLSADAGRFHFFAWIDPRRLDETMAFLEREASRVEGLKAHPSLAKRRIDDPAWRPFLDHAERRRLPVIVHCGRWQEMSSWRYCLTAAEWHPEAVIILAHLGGDDVVIQDECSREMMVRQLPNAYLGTESIREYYSLRAALDRLGPEKILFGSDYPLTWPGAGLAVVEGAQVSEEERRLVRGENLERLLRRRDS
jgi:predicted TIM-barrel fold metal-dependent hydrolase